MPLYQTFFSLSRGIEKPLRVPRGTAERCRAHVASVEKTLGYVPERYRDNPAHWNKRQALEVTDAVLCDVASRHNRWVRGFYEDLARWSAESCEEPAEFLTNENIQTFWQGLECIEVPPERWTRDYYVDRMEHLYKVMRGNGSEGVSLGTKALTPKQAAAVVDLFAVFLDRWDCRLDAPKGYDGLKASDDGGYVWCEKCGPRVYEDAQHCRRRECPVRAEGDL